MAATAGRYIWASPVIDLLDEQVPAFQKLAPSATCMPIHYEAKLKETVNRAISELGGQFTVHDHAAAFVTHNGFLAADATTLGGWHIRLDETPNAVASGVLNVRESISFFKDLYKLTPIPDRGWSRVSPIRSNRNWTHFQADDLGKHFVDFHAYAQRPEGLVINLHSWDEAQSNKCVEWYSAWTPMSLIGCGSVAMTGAGFFNSVAYRACQVLTPGKINFIRRAASNGIRSGQPQVRVHYFTRGHRGTTTLWDEDEGGYFLVQICKWLAEHVPELGFWSGNDTVCKQLRHRIAGIKTKPKLAGQNKLRDLTSCAFIYSGKSVENDRPLKTVLGMTDDEIIASRETEDIVQFAFRGAIRDPAYDGGYDIYLYNREQAQHLAHELNGYGILNVEIVPVLGAGIMDAMAGKRSNHFRTPEQIAARDERKREGDRRRQAKSRAGKKAKAAAENR